VNSPTFQPKIFLFERSDGRCAAIVGSSNLTPGGLDKNWESSVLVKGSTKDTFFKDLSSQIRSFDSIRLPITADLAEIYAAQAKENSKRPRLAHPILPSQGKKWKQASSPLGTMSWQDYVDAVKRSRTHNMKKRLKLLRVCQEMFARVSSFSELSTLEWKAIAGVIGERQQIEGGLGGHEWTWFGSMKGMGDFANRVSEKDRALSNAVDAIPRSGNITKFQYEVFCEHFIRAFENSTRKGGVPTASRLLAMKRPDMFVCISKPNKQGISNDLAFSASTLNLENYWERVVEPIGRSPWFNEERPVSGQLADLWDGRVAMLDAIYYEPE
jgi:hypothetical protein